MRIRPDPLYTTRYINTEGQAVADAAVQGYSPQVWSAGGHSMDTNKSKDLQKFY